MVMTMKTNKWLLSLLALHSINCVIPFTADGFAPLVVRSIIRDDESFLRPRQQSWIHVSRQRLRQSSSSFSSSSSSTTNTPSGGDNTISTPREKYRKVRQIKKYTRLPVWPAWNGVLLWLIGKVVGQERAAQLEDVITGRVCPNFFDEYTDGTSPFIMLVHHCHTFAPIDPLRAFQRLFFPEGFPAHPHRGFVTLTYFLQGGFRHRDSLGIEQVYGQGIGAQVTKHSQWLNTGAGILHEEMFYQPAWWSWQRQELYQLWINLPSGYKMNAPSLLLMGDDQETPVIRNKGSVCRVLAGRYDETTMAQAPIASDLLVMHVELDAGTTWTYSVPASYETLVVYVRKGSLSLTADADEPTTTKKIPVHHTAFFESTGDTLSLTATNDNRHADFLVLAGAPLREPVSAQGSMVMNYPDEINAAYRDYQLGLFGRPWPHTLQRDEWLSHVRENPSAYSRLVEVAVDDGET